MIFNISKVYPNINNKWCQSECQNTIPCKRIVIRWWITIYRKQSHISINPIDVYLVTGFEDLDWAKHVRHEGFKISYIAEALVYHVHDETWAQIYNRYFREAYAYKEIYPNEHFTFFEFVYVCAFSILQDWYVAVNRKQFMRSFTEIIFFRSLQYFATYKAYKLRGSPLSDLKRKLYYPVSSKFGMIKTRQNR